jgi:hypothetical protein
MELLLTAPFAVQGGLMVVDEFVYHWRRGLGRWERLGHPLDTLTVAACLAMAAWADFSLGRLALFAGLCVFSCLFVTKDEFVHRRECDTQEVWLHALLFQLHPLAFLSAGAIWYLRGTEPASRPALLVHVDAELLHTGLCVQLGLVGLFFVYQVLYWNVPWKLRTR